MQICIDMYGSADIIQPSHVTLLCFFAAKVSLPAIVRQ